MARKSKNDWLAVGLDLLEKGGAENITIEKLCRKLNVTKGSYYHHFPAGRRGFLRNLILYWESEHTNRIVSLVEADGTPAEKLGRLAALTNEISAELELAIRGWAQSDMEVLAVVVRVDQKRLRRTQALYRSVLKDDSAGDKMGKLGYIFYLGSRLLFPPLSTTEMEELSHFLQKNIIKK